MVLSRQMRLAVVRFLGTAVVSTGFCGAALASDDQLAQAEVIGEDGYNKTYSDESKSFKDRMGDARSTPEATLTNDRGGIFLGVNGMFGPVYDAEPGSSSGFGYGVGVEPGFAIQNDSWSRIELGLQIAQNSFSWKGEEVGGKSPTYTLAPLTFLPRVGWGNSLGNNLFGMAKIGFGFGTGDMEMKQGDYKVKLKGSSGLLFSGDYDVIYGAGTMQWTGGVGVVHHKYTWDSATVNGVKFDDVDKVTNLNFINLHGGVRIQF